jgi:hypothetical protein
MRRTRAIAIFGLVLGLSGCAGAHHHQHFPVVGGMPNGPHGQVRPDCACRTASARHPTGVGAGPSTVVATVATQPSLPAISPAPRPSLPAISPAPRPAVPSTSTASGPTPPSQSPPSWTPPSSRPVAVPAPAGVARYYFPLFEGDGLRSVWDTVPPDLLGVRTSMAPAAAPGDESPTPPSQETPGTLSLSPTGSSGPAAVKPPGATPSPSPLATVAASAHSGEFKGDVVPVSAVVSTPANASPGLLPPPGTIDLPPARPDLAVGDASAKPAKTLVLEHADATELAGRPHWQPPTEPPLVKHDQDEPSSWVSELAFQRPKKPSGTNLHLPQVLRGDVRPAAPRRETPVSRFVRRIQVAGRAFLDPDSVGRESRQLPQQGEGVERASTHRLGEAAKR